MIRPDWKSTIAIFFVVLLVVSSGCVTLKNFKHSIKNPPTPIPTVIPTLTSMPTPEPIVSQPAVYSTITESQGEYMKRTMGRWMGQSYQWYRANVSGLKDLHVSVMIYRYKWLDDYDYWSDTWGYYFHQDPMYGQKYLVIFPQMCAIGKDPSMDGRMWGMGQDHFYVQYKDRVIGPDGDHLIGARIKELEETYTKNDDMRVYDYGYERVRTWNRTNVAQSLAYLQLGTSNCWDGYILYSVPKDAKIEDIKVLGRFDGFGNAWWYLGQ
jgi:hypothetical protein